MLPQKAPDAGLPRQHFRCHNDEPGDAQRKAKAGKHIRQSGGQKDFEKRLGLREPKDFGNVKVILRNCANTDRIQDRWPHRTDRDRENGGKVRRGVTKAGSGNR